MKYQSPEKHTKHGFTLVEMSIVLVIVGLLVAGVGGGVDLMHSAKLRTVISDINGFNLAIAAYDLLGIG